MSDESEPHEVDRDPQVVPIVKLLIEKTKLLLDSIRRNSLAEQVIAYDEFIEALREQRNKTHKAFQELRASRHPVPIHPTAPPVSRPFPPPPPIPSVAARIIHQQIPTEMLPATRKGRTPKKKGRRRKH